MHNLAKDPKYNSSNAIPFAFKEGDIVRKTSGDYIFEGIILCAFRKRSGSPRYVVENEDGIIHIFNHSQLEFANV